MSFGGGAFGSGLDDLLGVGSVSSIFGKGGGGGAFNSATGSNSGFSPSGTLLRGSTGILGGGV